MSGAVPPTASAPAAPTAVCPAEDPPPPPNVAPVAANGITISAASHAEETIVAVPVTAVVAAVTCWATVRYCPDPACAVAISAYPPAGSPVGEPPPLPLTNAVIAQLDAWLSALDAPAAVHTGCRLSEVVSATVGDTPSAAVSASQ